MQGKKSHGHGEGEKERKKVTGSRGGKTHRVEGENKVTRLPTSQGRGEEKRKVRVGTENVLANDRTDRSEVTEKVRLTLNAAVFVRTI